MGTCSASGIQGCADVVAGNGRLAMLRVGSADADGEIYLQGAHVTSWKPAGQQEVLWLSREGWWDEGKPIRGGVPICFPWFGPNRETPDAPLHGFARLQEWEIESVAPQNGSTTVTMLARSGTATEKWWPGQFELRYRVTFGSELTMCLELTNTGNESFSAELALHSYFSVGDVREIEIRGLDGVRYVDKLDSFKEKKQQGNIRIDAETDRIYLDTPAALDIIDPVMRRRIRVSKQGSTETVVWNPWVSKSKAMPDFGDEEWTGMICVETCNVQQGAVSLAPGQQHTTTTVIDVIGL